MITFANDKFKRSFKLVVSRKNTENIYKGEVLRV